MSLNLTEMIDTVGEYGAGTPTRKDKQEKADAMGLKMVVGSPDLLLIDLDNGASLDKFNENLNILKEFPAHFIKGYLLTKSKSGNTHAYVKLKKEFGVLERIGLQAVLGSDTKRESLSVLELTKEYEEPTVLFETPSEYDKVMQWLGS